ncbi:TRAP transporter small permease [Roseobacter litoralis]|uniref:TRAP transporter small permease protein n=1 Tax=Roseobacter litoralis (strain ATCC 49566 / DSM 6996 / JCM 21268 / NBRC 15278 / OCh 149) TaxID=391595 RepID=F7ZA04_ROSLO|nr:TRAP transporter small permease subunit [Roseobacter litoralis]AEI94157.1 putative TRAP transporter subunit DctQ [Roseobacter litoralis Och 149]
MGALLLVLAPLRMINESVLAIGRAIGIFAVAAMVIAILVQVFFRYVLNSALPWPDEAARFCMLWMTGLMAPTAFRRGGFVAIDTLVILLPKLLGSLLALFLLFVSLAVLVVAVQIGWSEVTGFAGRFATASLYVPTDLSLENWFRVPRSWMMASLVVGLIMLISVNVELILRAIVRMLGGADRLPAIPLDEKIGAE